MEILKLLASAENSSDLKHHERECHVDVLGAAGMTSGQNGHLAVYRVKYMNDVESVLEAKNQFTKWTRRAMVRRSVKLSPDKVGADALAKWIDDICTSCKGLKFQKMRGTPTLMDRPCAECNGKGTKKINGDYNTVQVILDVMGRADRVVDNIKSELSFRLGKK